MQKGLFWGCGPRNQSLECNWEKILRQLTLFLVLHSFFLEFIIINKLGLISKAERTVAKLLDNILFFSFSSFFLRIPGSFRRIRELENFSSPFFFFFFFFIIFGKLDKDSWKFLVTIFLFLFLFLLFLISYLPTISRGIVVNKWQEIFDKLLI